MDDASVDGADEMIMMFVVVLQNVDDGMILLVLVLMTDGIGHDTGGIGRQYGDGVWSFW